MSLTAPDASNVPEFILKNAQLSYHIAPDSTVTHYKRYDGRYQYGIERRELEMLREYCYPGGLFLERGAWRDGFQMLDWGSRYITDIVKAQPPDLLHSLFELAILFRTEKRAEVAEILTQQFLGVAIIVLPPIHPLRTCLETLCSIPREVFDGIIYALEEMFVDETVKRFGPSHVRTLDYEIKCLIRKGNVLGLDYVEARLFSTL